MLSGKSAHLSLKSPVREEQPTRLRNWGSEILHITPFIYREADFVGHSIIQENFRRKPSAVYPNNSQKLNGALDNNVMMSHDEPNFGPVPGGF